MTYRLRCWLLLPICCMLACDQAKQQQRYDRIADEQKMEEVKIEVAEVNEKDEDHPSAAAAFKKFRQLVIDKNGEAAAEYVDSTTFDFFKKAIRLAKKADSLTLCKESLITRFYVLYIRHQVDKKDITALTPAKIIAHILNKGVIVNENLALAGDNIDLKMADEERLCGVIENTMNHICLNKNKKGWGIDLTSFFDRQAQSIRYGAEYRKIDVNSNIKYSLAEVTNYEVKKNPLWEKMQ